MVELSRGMSVGGRDDTWHTKEVVIATSCVAVPTCLEVQVCRLE
jgi:hypothetical protein